jgi:D-alanine-D-alanine ligase-like ATP-grasp enzyme
LHDILDLDRRGIPGGFVASEEFVEAAIAQAKSLGFDPHKVFVPHPIQDRTDEEMQEIAENAFEQVLALILRREDTSP